jgi:hypothetical protein
MLTLNIIRFIDGEADACARRNAFLFLFNEAEELSIEFLNTHMDHVKDYGDGFALLVLELCRKVYTITFNLAKDNRELACLLEYRQHGYCW